MLYERKCLFAYTRGGAADKSHPLGAHIAITFTEPKHTFSCVYKCTRVIKKTTELDESAMDAPTQVLQPYCRGVTFRAQVML